MCHIRILLVTVVLALPAAEVTPVMMEPTPAPTTQASKLCAQAWAQVQVANWEEAIRFFGEAEKAGDAIDEDRAGAMYGQAYCWQYRNLDADLGKARELYGRVLQDYPKTRPVPYVLMEQARIADMPVQEGDRRPEDAVTLYRRIIAEYPDHVMADEATLWLATDLRSRTDRARADEGMQLLVDRLAVRPDNPLATTMNNHLAKEHIRRGVDQDSDEEFRRALACYEQCERVGLPTIRMRSGICFQAARIAELRLKDYATAIRWYRVIAEEIPNDRWYSVSKMAIIRCEGLLAGDKEAKDG